ncbi:flagellin N-terminal helical domain-containing protein [Alienimonas californiensis]|uniref:Flagellin n=1 Tax=Alienimonas californiensis TaxID=2527989 RepID=A0A517P979_9PLAN|nr:flagellin [Alienimonas californiensis]QDT15929.1 A-type flagellin [Alienimonas californiensis]
MTRINTNVASLRGQRSMAKSDKMLASAMTRLSTGVKINNGKDDPSGLIAGETLGSQISTIEKSISNSNRANNVLTTADGALGEIGGLLNQVRGLVQEGLNDGALSQEERDANQLQIDNALTAINRISSNTSFAGDKLLDGSKAFTTTISSADNAKLSSYSINQALLGSASKLDLDATIDSAAEQASLVYSGGDFTSAATLEIGGRNGTEVVQLGDSASMEDVTTAVNALTDATGVSARVLDGTVASGNQVIAVNSQDVEFALTEAGRKLVDGGGLSIEIVAPSADTTESIELIDNEDGTFTAKMTLGYGSGAITSDIDAIVTAFDGLTNSDGDTLFDVAAAADAVGATLGTALAETDLDKGALRIDDVRGPNNRGGVSLAFTATGTSQALGISVSGDDITIQLATDANDVVTSTLEDIKDLLDSSGLTLSDGTSIAEALNIEIDGDKDLLANGLSASELDTTNGTSLVLESEAYGSDEFVSVNVLNGTFGTTGIGDFSTELRRDSGEDIVASINGQKAVGRGLTASINTANLTASVTFDSASNSKDESVAIDVTGGGAVFQIGQDVTISGQVGIGIDAVNTARLGGTAGKLFELTSGGGKSLSDVASGNASGADLVNILDGAINEVSSLRGRIGAVQKNVIDTNINTLGVALENISEARSQIMDTDFAVESANLQKAQILGQAATSVLSIANQSPQRALSLLG